MRLLLRLLEVFRFRYKLLLLVFVAVLSAVIAGSYVRKPNYESTSLILVKLVQNQVSISQSNIRNSLVNLQLVEAIASQTEILQSNSMIESVIETLGPEVLAADKKSNNVIVAKISSLLKAASKGVKDMLIAMKLKDPIEQKYVLMKKIRKGLKINPLRKSQLIEVIYRDKNPAVAQIVVETLIDLFLKKSRSLQEGSDNFMFFSAQAENLKEKLKMAEKKFSDFKLSYSVLSFDDEKRLLLEKRNQIFTLLDGLSNSTVSSTGQGSMLAAPQMVQYRQQLISLRTQRSKLLTTYGVSHKLIKELDNQITELKIFINDERKTLLAKVKTYDARMLLLTKIEPEYNDLAREVRTRQEAYGVYGKVSEDRALAREQQDYLNFQIIDEPSLPYEAVFPTRLQIIGLGSVFALFFSLFSVIIIEWISIRRNEYYENNLFSSEI